MAAAPGVHSCLVVRRTGNDVPMTAVRDRWHHELDVHNRPSGVVWDGKPDIYHAGQTLLLADVPVTGSLAESVKAAVSR